MLALLPGRLEDAQLRLQLERMAAERVECFADRVGVVAAVLGLAQVVEPRKRRQACS